MIEVDDIPIKEFKRRLGNFFCLTDILKARITKLTVSDWLRTRRTLEMLFEWEYIHNEKFNCGEFATIMEAVKRKGATTFRISMKHWIERTSAIGLIVWPGRFGGTYGHTNIALEFADWVDPLFKGWFTDALGELPLRK